MDYLWMKNIEPPRFGALDGDAKTDVLVIGGGMAGILCALHLEEAGVAYMLVEGKTIGTGITKGTTAVLTAQHDALYRDIISRFGREKAKQYLEANLKAVERFRQLAQRIPCDFVESPSFMYALHDRDMMEDEAAAVQSLGFGAEFTTQTPLPYAVAGAVRFGGMAMFHPLKFLYGAAKDLAIWENTFVQRLKGTTAFTERGTIRAKKVIVATHFPFINSHGLYFMKLYQKRSFVLALKNAPDLGCTIMDAAENSVYLRNYDDLLLLGGGDHRTGKSGGGFAFVRSFAQRHFPQATEQYAWANQDCMSLDGLPYIGPYSSGLPNVYVATGFNEWGMSPSMAAAAILTDMVMDKENPYAQAFCPARNMLTGQLFANLGTSVLDFITPTTKRCSHMGCTLKWNRDEHSWDCPCHGSRFDAHGHVIDNPAMRKSHVE